MGEVSPRADATSGDTGPLSLAVRNSPGILWAAGPDGARTFLNSRWAALIGDAGAWNDHLHPDDAPGVLRQVELSLREGLPFREHYRVLRADGSACPVEDHADITRDAAGRVSGLSGLITDLSRHDQLERTLRDTELQLDRRLAELAMLYDSSPAGLALLDLQNRFLRVNNRMAEIDGEPTEHHLGRSLRELAPELADLAEPLLEQARATGRPIRDAERRPHAPGLPPAADWLLTVCPVRDLSGKTVSLGLLVHDVSRHRLAETELRNVRRLESLSRLADGIAHDFNNLLTIILGNCEQDRPDPAHAAAFAAIEEAARRGSELSAQLAGFAHRRPAAHRRCDAGSLVRQAAPMLSRLLQDDIKLRIDAPESALPVELDPDAFTEMLLDAASRARQDMPRGGLLRIRVGRLDWTSDLFNRDPEAPPGAYARVTIHNSGSLPRPTTCVTDLRPGDDPLGLPFTRELVHQAGGFLRGRRDPSGQGAVELIFPLAFATPTTQRSSPAALHARLLLVDDEPAVCGVMAAALRQAGFDVIPAAGPGDAIGIAQRPGPIDLLITDLLMPGMRGDELAARLRACRPDLRVIFVTGSSDTDLPPADILTKPFSPAKLVERVRDALSRVPASLRAAA